MASVVVLDSESDDFHDSKTIWNFPQPENGSRIGTFWPTSGGFRRRSDDPNGFSKFLPQGVRLILKPPRYSTTKTLTTSTSKPYGLKSWLSHDIVALLGPTPAMMETCHNRQLGVLRITPIYKPWSSAIWKGDHHR